MRNKYISVIHAQKTAAGLEDDVYRSIIISLTNKDSSKDLSLAQLAELHNALNNVLEKQGQQRFFIKRKNTQAEYVESLARDVLGAHYQQRLSGFLSKMGRKTIGECDQNEMRRLCGFLHGVKRKNNLG